MGQGTADSGWTLTFKLPILFPSTGNVILIMSHGFKNYMAEFLSLLPWQRSHRVDLN